MSKKTLRLQVSTLMISVLITLPSLVAAQENQPVTASPQHSQSENMDNMSHEEMSHEGMDHKEMVDKKSGVNNKTNGKTTPKATDDTPPTSEPTEPTSEQHDMPMNNDM